MKCMKTGRSLHLPVLPGVLLSLMMSSTVFAQSPFDQTIKSLQEWERRTCQNMKVPSHRCPKATGKAATVKPARPISPPAEQKPGGAAKAIDIDTTEQKREARQLSREPAKSARQAAPRPTFKPMQVQPPAPADNAASKPPATDISPTPRPREKPHDVMEPKAPPPPVATSQSTLTAQDKAIAPAIIPPPRAAPSAPPQALAGLPSSAQPPPPEKTSEATSCLQQLKTMQVTVDQVAQPGAGACTVDNPVQLRSIRAGKDSILLPDSPTLACGFAVQFSRWLQETAAPMVVAQSKSAIAKLYTGPGFQCRGRNGDTTAKISEHGKGNAVDIERIALANGTMLDVKDAQAPASPSYTTLKGLRGSACGYFTTVLGPGANAAHESHFHFDMAVRGKKGSYRICE